MIIKNHVMPSYFNLQRLSKTKIIQYGLIGLWTLAMIMLPIAKWLLGDEIIPQAVSIALMFQFIAVFYIISSVWGIKRALIILGIIALMTWAIETIGSTTGFPFGGYHYTDLLKPQVQNVPLLVPLAWFMMLPSSWAVAHSIIGTSIYPRYRTVLFILMSGLAITAWDLFLDPQMVAWGFWRWELASDFNGLTYFGIPLVNYVGWLLTAILVTLVIRPDRMPTLPIKPLLLIYAITWFLETFGLALFWWQLGPALIGGIIMGGFMIWAIRNHLNESRT